MYRIQLAISLVLILLGCGSNVDIQTASARSQAVLDTITVYEISTKQMQNDDIPDSVFQMINLKKLTVIGTDCDYGGDSCWLLSEIPKQIVRLVNMETLSIPVNNIDTLPKEITALKKLKHLDLTDNPGLEHIDVVTELENLESLGLFGCNIRQLPNGIEKLKHLKFLGLTGNPITITELQRARKALPNCEILF